MVALIIKLSVTLSVRNPYGNPYGNPSVGALVAPGLAAELCLDVQYRFVDRGGARLNTALNP